MSTNENDSLSGFDVGDFLSALDRDVRSGKKIGDASDPQSLENELREKEKEELREFHINLLNTAFPTIDHPIRELAQKFKTFFDYRKIDAVQNARIPPRERWLILNTTIDDLAQTALREHETYVRRSGQAVNGSFEEGSLQHQAKRWDRIHEVIRAASEIKD